MSGMVFSETRRCHVMGVEKSAPESNILSLHVGGSIVNQRTSPVPKKCAGIDGTPMAVKRRWTAEDDAVVRRHAGKIKDGEIAVLIGRTGAAVKGRRQQLLAVRQAPPDWTAAEVEILRERYASLSPAELRAMLPGRSDGSIHHKVSKMGLRRHKPRASSGRAWTDEEDETMRVLYPDNAVSLLCNHLPSRSQKAIERRAHALGLQHSEKFWAHHYSTKISLGCYPAELQEVIRLGRKLKKAINDHESQHP